MSGYRGEDSFTYTISDGRGGEDTAVVWVEIEEAANQAPIASDDVANTIIDTPVTIDVLTNDSDADGDTLSITAVSTAEHGSVSIDSGQILYTPDAEFTGTDTFTYTISDGNGSNDTAEVTINITENCSTLILDESGRLVLDTSTLSPSAGFIIQGDAAGDRLGYSVSTAGDINGDGYADLIVGAAGGADGGTDAGEAYVLFGKAGGFGSVDGTGRLVVDTSSLSPDDGFIIQGDAAYNYLGVSVSTAGDINGDGYADLIVGARYGYGGGATAGQAYVLFGKAGGFGSLDGTGRSVVDTTSLSPDEGFIIQGDTADDYLGVSVSTAGDINGDGYADLIVGALGGDDGGYGAGEAYVLLGKAAGFGSVDGTGRSVVDTSSLSPDEGFIIQGDAAFDDLGTSVSTAGDINGDGYADLIVGAGEGDDGGSGAGEAYVLFGKASGFGSVDVTGRSVVDTSSLSPDDGFIIQGDDYGDWLGISVSTAGDMNGDGYADLIVGASHGDDGGSGAGEAYVLFGKAGGFGSVDGTGRLVVDTSSLSPDDGFIILGDAADDYLGYSVSTAGDINGDGYADLIVGAGEGDDGGSNAGEAYVLFGKAGGFGSVDETGRSVVDTSSLSPDDGFIIQGDDADDLLGRSVSTAGDINRDDYADLIVGAAGGADGGTDAGEAYVIYGCAGFGSESQSNTAPDAEDDTVYLSGTAPSITPVTIDALANDSDADGDTLTITSVSDPTYGSVLIQDSKISYAPQIPQTGILENVSFTYTVSDGNGGEDTAMVWIDLENVNRAPNATADIAYTDEGVPVNIDVLANDSDADGDSLTISTEVAPLYGAVSVADGLITYTPMSGYSGEDSFTYTISDGRGGEDTAVVWVEIEEAANQAPVASDDVANTIIDTPVTIDVLTNDSDADGDTLSITTVSIPEHGNVAIDSGQILYTPDAEFTGTDTFTYTISDGNGSNDTAEVTVNITENCMTLIPDESGRLVLDTSTLSPSAGFIIQGDELYNFLGHSVSSAGDINGDGLDDLIVGAYAGDGAGYTAGEAYVIYGGNFGSVDSTGRAVIDTTNLSPSEGFIIQGDAEFDLLGWSVSSAGDINGDGLDDIIVGAHRGDGAEVEGSSHVGEAYVIYGGTSGNVDNTGRAVIDTTFLSPNEGVIIYYDGIYAKTSLGYSVSSAGDINADGLDDVVVGVPRANNESYGDVGEAVVIFGGSFDSVDSTGRAAIDTSSLSVSEGFIIKGDAGGDNLGVSVSSAGDINGDGVEDLIVGAYGGDDGGTGAGEAYVIYGGSDFDSVDGTGSAAIDISSLSPSEGFIIQGDAEYDRLGLPVSSAGDINGDGLGDLIVGAWRGGNYTLDAYVIYGGSFGSVDSTGRAFIDTTTLSPSDGFMIKGGMGSGDSYDSYGAFVSSAGDINGDGLDDLIVGASRGNGGTGEAYVIYGGSPGSIDSTGRAVVDTSRLSPSEGFIIDGDDSGDHFGVSVASAGDINGDGVDDLIVGADWGDDGGDYYAGEAYVIYGCAGLSPEPPPNTEPVAREDSASTNDATPVVIDVLANDSDEDGDLLTIVSITTPESGSAAIVDNQIVYTPVLFDEGGEDFDALTYTISDGNGGTATAEVWIDIEGSNQPPTATDDEVNTIEGICNYRCPS